MYVSKKILAIAVGFVLVGAAIAALGLLYMELSQANADLRETKADLQQTSNTLVASKEVNANLTREYAALQRVKEEQDDTLVAYEEQRKNLDGELTATRQSLAQSHAEVAKGNVEIEKGSTEIRRLDSELAKANTTISDLATSRQALQRNYNELVAANGTIGTLKAEETWLRNEISRLEAVRGPLILGHNDTKRAGFLCTGSMEPAMTCLDEMTWLEDFLPEDITVGTIISFSPDCRDDTPETSFTAHRVVEITVRNGVHYYWPKGDNNLEADGCWVPEHHVNGYLIEIHKNVNMENEHLRRMVNGAYSAMLNATARYLDLVEQVCGVRDIDACPNWRIRQASTQMLEVVLRAYDTADRAWNHYNCWYQNALDSQRPGHIPYSC